jgi:cytochrome c-type biogenesis protein CcmH/NrfG
MTLWLVIALMTAAVVFAVLWPLARRVFASEPDKLRRIEDTIERLGLES